MGEIINGKLIAEKVKNEIREFINIRQNDEKSIPKIASILVGNDEGSIFYLNNQEKISLSLGLDFLKIHLSEDIKEEELINKINELNNDKSISGIIIQLPLPKELNEKRVVSAISEEKDIDCLTYINQGKLYMGDETFLPCTPHSVITILKSLDISLEGKEVVVVGRSNIVGKPVANLMLKENCTVTICHSKTRDLKKVCSGADILIVAIGKAKFIDKSFVKEGAIVIDVGTSSLNGKITGDVNLEDVIEKASLVTPVPGGVGALTTTLLIKNACEAKKKYED